MKISGIQLSRTRWLFDIVRNILLTCVCRMDFVEADMAHAQTPFYVVQNLITTLLHLEGCTSVSEREAKILDYIQDEDLKTELCLLNDLLGTHVC